MSIPNRTEDIYLSRLNRTATLEELGRKYGISRERVRQIQTKEFERRGTDSRCLTCGQALWNLGSKYCGSFSDPTSCAGKHRAERAAEYKKRFLAKHPRAITRTEQCQRCGKPIEVVGKQRRKYCGNYKHKTGCSYLVALARCKAITKRKYQALMLPRRPCIQCGITVERTAETKRLSSVCKKCNQTRNFIRHAIKQALQNWRKSTSPKRERKLTHYSRLDKIIKRLRYKPYPTWEQLKQL